MKISFGFTVVELIVVMAIFAVLVSMTGVLLLGTQRQVNMTSTLVRLTNEIKEQQLKAMVGDTGGSGSVTPSGVYFYTDRYVLFRGTTFNPSDTANYVTNLEYGLQFDPINLPDSQILFSPGTGEVSGYSSTLDNVVLKNIANLDTKTIKISKLGVVVSIN